MSTKTLRLHKKLQREFGPHICALLNRAEITNILLNDDSTIWIEELNQPMRCVGKLASHQADAAIKTVAACYQTTVTERNPIIEGQFPLDGHSRFEALIPPVVKQPIFAIRKHTQHTLSFEDYVKQKVMSPHCAELIKAHIQKRDNIIVCGGTGSGKATLLNSCIKYAVHHFPNQRRVIIEDTPELKRHAPNCLMLQTHEGDPKMDGRTLLKATMRLYPDAIDYGEVRDGAAHTLLKAWTTGHQGGFGTIHVPHQKNGILRLEQLLLESSSRPMPHLIGEAVQLFINIQKSHDEVGRHITNITALHGYKDGQYLTQQLL